MPKAVKAMPKAVKALPKEKDREMAKDFHKKGWEEHAEVYHGIGSGDNELPLYSV